jgi:hypothetical protein
MTRVSRSGTALTIIGVTLVVIGVILKSAVLGPYPFILQSPLPWRPTPSTQGVINFIVPTLIFYVGFFLFWRGRQYAAKANTERIVTDSNPDVLYLRSFRSDPSTARYVFSSALTSQFETEEEQLRDVLRPIGDLVTIGKPGEDLPTPGAARIYVSDEEWKEEVQRRMRAARLVVIRAGVGENLLWEAKHAFETLNPQKVLILVLNMKPKDYESFRTKVNPLLGVSLPEGATLPRLWRRVSGFIDFAADWKPSFFPLPPPPFFRSNPFNLYEASFKFALRPVFERFGQEWQPPPFSLVQVLLIAGPLLFTLLIQRLLKWLQLFASAGSL